MSNYGGTRANTSTYVKNFNVSKNIDSWFYSQNYNVNTNSLYLKPTNSSATVYISGDLLIGGSINTPSDIKLKYDVKPLDLKISNDIMLLNPVSYKYKVDETGKEHIGFIAQEVEEYFPNLVNTIEIDEEIIKTVNYLEIIPILLLKIKDLQSQLDKINKF